MDLIAKLVTSINGILWDYILIYALVGIGLFFTIYLGAPQIMQFGAGFKSVFGGLFNKNKGEKDHQALSQFQALAVAISAQIGTGNVAGVATAITAGGAGAIFWMWLSAFLVCPPFLPKPFWRKNTASSVMANTLAAPRFTSHTV